MQHHTTSITGVKNRGKITGNVYVGGTHHHTRKSDARLPVAWNLPPPNASFIERETFSNELDGHFFLKNEDESFVLKKSGPAILAVISGLGGVGKTTLAKNFLYDHINSFKSCVWLNAKNESDFLKEYREFAGDCGIENKDKDGNEKEISIVCRQLNSYLAKNSKWLMVIDNADNKEKIESYLPRIGGAVLLTSRRNDWDAEVIPVDVLTPPQAREMYFKLSERHQNEQSVDKLVKKLGYLPLAIAQAAGFVKNLKGTTTAEYLQSFERDRSILDKNELRKNATVEDVSRLTVMTTWNISIEAIEKHLQREGLESNQPNVRTLLVALSYLHANHIRQNFIEKWAINTFSKTNTGYRGVIALLKSYLSTQETEDKVTLIKNHVRKVIGLLTAYSLIQEVEDQVFSIHPLVQDTIHYRYKRKDNDMLGNDSEVYPEVLIQLFISSAVNSERGLFSEWDLLSEHIENLNSRETTLSQRRRVSDRLLSLVDEPGDEYGYFHDKVNKAFVAWGDQADDSEMQEIISKLVNLLKKDLLGWFHPAKGLLNHFRHKMTTNHKRDIINILLESLKNNKKKNEYDMEGFVVATDLLELFKNLDNSERNFVIEKFVEKAVDCWSENDRDSQETFGNNGHDYCKNMTNSAAFSVINYILNMKNINKSHLRVLGSFDYLAIKADDSLKKGILEKVRPLCTHEDEWVRDVAQDVFNGWGKIPDEPQQANKKTKIMNIHASSSSTSKPYNPLQKNQQQQINSNNNYKDDSDEDNDNDNKQDNGCFFM